MPSLNIKVKGSAGCCGVYEVHGIIGVPPDKFKQEIIGGVYRETKTMWVDWVISEVKRHGQDKMPAIVWFTDYTSSANPCWGDRWMSHLRALGFRVDKFSIGRNPKTTHFLNMYHWYVGATGQPLRVSLIKEYTAKEEKDEQEKQDRIRKYRPVTGKGVEAGRGSSLSRAVRSLRQGLAGNKGA